MTVFGDTGPQPDGRRTRKQWLNAMNEDMSLIKHYVADAMDADDAAFKAQRIALAAKEARRLERDLMRFAQEIYGIERDTIRSVRV